MAVGALRQPHGLEYSAVARWAIYILFALGALFSLLLTVSQLFWVFTMPSKYDRVGATLVAFSLLSVLIACVGTIVGLVRGEEWGRTMATYVGGFLYSTGVLMPIAAGLLWVLYHPHLPDRARDAAKHVVDAARTAHEDSPAAHPRPADGLSKGRRWAIVVILALTQLLLVFFLVTAIATANQVDLAWAIVGFVYVALMVLANAAAIVGLGRGLPWGRAAVTFCTGITVLTGYLWVPALVVLALLYWPPTRQQEMATAPTS